MNSTHINFKKESYDAGMPLFEQNNNDRKKAYLRRSSPNIDKMYGAIIMPIKLELYAESIEKLEDMIDKFIKHTNCEQVRHL